jgi:hypothetical protein
MFVCCSFSQFSGIIASDFIERSGNVIEVLTEYAVGGLQNPQIVVLTFFDFGVVHCATLTIDLVHFHLAIQNDECEVFYGSLLKFALVVFGRVCHFEECPGLCG